MPTLDYQQALDMGYSPSEIDQFSSQNKDIQVTNKPSETSLPKITTKITPKVTQAFNVYNPSLERFSPGGRNIGVDLEANSGTPVYTPQGSWKVVESYNGAKGQGHIGNNENRGYGNSVLIQNTDTGEKLRTSHLSEVGATQGQVLTAGLPIGKTGATGNVTGPHLDLEYYDKSGKLGDASKTTYVNNVFNPISGQ